MTLAEANRRDFLKVAAGSTAAAAAAALIDRPHHAIAAEITAGQRAALSGIDNAFQKAVDEHKIPGVVAMAATDKGIIYDTAIGYRDVASGRRMSLDTVFWIASMTKAVTGTACMQLVEQGKLKLDQKMGDLLPYLAEVQVLEGFDASGQPKLRPPKRPITLQHLLTHTAGFTYDIWSEPMLQYEKVTGIPFIGSCKTAALRAPLMFDPGDRWEYGINIDWVGRAVETVSGQSLEVYFREHIFEPLGMTNTGFLIGSKQRAQTARLYQKDGSGGMTVAPEGPLMPQNPEFFMGGGGLFSTAPDYMAFLQMLLNNGTFNEAQVLKPETVAQMRQNHIGDLNVVTLKTTQPNVSKDANFFPDMAHKWGLSFDINTKPGPHGRNADSLCWAGLFNTFFWIDPKARVTGTIMTQTLPFVNDDVMDLYAQFESGIYSSLKAS